MIKTLIQQYTQNSRDLREELTPLHLVNIPKPLSAGIEHPTLEEATTELVSRFVPPEVIPFPWLRAEVTDGTRTDGVVPI